MAGTVCFIDPAGWGRGAATWLRDTGFAVFSVKNLSEATRLARRRPPDHVVVVASSDCSTAGEALAWVECNGPCSLTLVLDPVDDDQLEELFAAGAADVVSPQCIPELFAARVRAVLRRNGTLPCAIDAPITIGEVTLDARNRRVWVAGEAVHLTPLEFALLHTLMRDAGVVYSREDLLQMIWGERGPTMDRTIDAHIWKLRRKIEVDASRPRYICSVQRLGYRFQSAEHAFAKPLEAIAV